MTPEVSLEPDCVTLCVCILRCINTQSDGTGLDKRGGGIS